MQGIITLKVSLSDCHIDNDKVIYNVATPFLSFSLDLNPCLPVRKTNAYYL